MDAYGIALLAAGCTILTFILTLLISTSHFRQSVMKNVISDVKSNFGDEFMKKEDHIKCSQQTCERLDGIQDKLLKSSKEFLVLRLIMMEAKLVPREKIEEIRDTVMNGDFK